MKRYAWVLLAVLFAACSDDSSGPREDLSGTYTLRTVNGHNVPHVVFDFENVYKVEVLSGTLILTSGSFISTMIVRETENGTATTKTESDSGTYTRTDNTITLRDSDDGDTVTATISGGTITAVQDGFTIVYQR